MSKKKFVVKKLIESYEIQESYDNGEYFEAVLKCCIYLESWLFEYIIAILFPTKGTATKENRQLVMDRFADMYFQIHWLRENGYINKNDYDNLNNIRTFCSKVLRAGDVFKVVGLERLDRYIEITIHYCSKFKNQTMKLIQEATAKLMAVKM